jgi:manganese-dependent inorganic pyrophosphatase
MKTEEEVFVIGHKNPDTDSVVSAIVYAGIRGFLPAAAGEINRETAFTLDYFKVPKPEILTNAEGRKLVLVDHNEASQMIDGGEKAEILEIIDHHRFNFSCSSPIYIHNEPLGSTATIIAKKYAAEIKNHPEWAGLLLAAILSDTVVFKSPTTTEEDKIIAAELALIAGISDIVNFGIEIKKANASIKSKTISEIINADFKDFDFSGKKIGIGQAEIVDLSEIYERKKEIASELKSIREKGGYAGVFFMATDIMKEGTELFFDADPEAVEKAFAKNPVENSVYLGGVMSRKKQVVPELEKAFAG